MSLPRDNAKNKKTLSTPILNFPEQDLWDFLFENAQAEDEETFKNRVIFRTADTDSTDNSLSTLSLATIKCRAIAFGRHLQRTYNFQPGDVVSIVAHNTMSTPSLILGIWWAGGVVANEIVDGLRSIRPYGNISRGLSPMELAGHLVDHKTSIVVTETRYLEIVHQAIEAARIPFTNLLAISAARGISSQNSIDELWRWAEVGGGEQNLEHGKFGQVIGRVKRHTNDVAVIFVRSGTTGGAKGVMLSHRNLLSNLVMLKHDRSSLSWARPGHLVLATVPWYHIYGFSLTLLNSMYRQIETVVLPTFDFTSFCKAIQHWHITHTYIYPPIVKLLATAPATRCYNLSSLQGIMSAASSLDTALIKTVFARLQVPIIQAYGLSETSPVITMQDLFDWEKTMGSVGRPLPGLVVKIAPLNRGAPVSFPALPPHMIPSVKPLATPLPPYTEGELLVAGPNVFVGYTNEPHFPGEPHALRFGEEPDRSPEDHAPAKKHKQGHDRSKLPTRFQPHINSHSFSRHRPSCITSDGFLRTGDLAYMDESGNVYIKERISALIRTQQDTFVVPSEIEDMLRACPGVLDACVVGIDPPRTERGRRRRRTNSSSSSSGFGTGGIFFGSESPYQLPLAAIVTPESQVGRGKPSLPLSGLIGFPNEAAAQARVDAIYSFLYGGKRFVGEVPFKSRSRRDSNDMSVSASASPLSEEDHSADDGEIRDEDPPTQMIKEEEQADKYAAGIRLVSDAQRLRGGIVFMPEIRSASGKLTRRMVSERLWNLRKWFGKGFEEYVDV